MKLQDVKAVQTNETFRTLAYSAWHRPKDPSIYATLTIDDEPVQSLVDELKEKGGGNVDRLAIILHLLGQVIAEVPALSFLAQWGQLKQRNGIRLFVPVVINDDRSYDLYGISIDDPHTQDIDDLGNDIAKKTKRVRSDQDPQVRRVRTLLKRVPSWLIKPFLSLGYRLMYRWNISLEWLGLPGDRFGQAIVSPLYMLGIRHAYIPLYGHATANLSVAIGAVFEGLRWNAKVEKAEPCRQFYLTITGDHRFFDGHHAGQAIKRLEKRLADPKRYVSFSKE